MLSKLVFSLISDLQDGNEKLIENMWSIGVNWNRVDDIEDAIKYSQIYVRKLRNKMGYNSKDDALGFIKKL